MSAALCEIERNLILIFDKNETRLKRPMEIWVRVHYNFEGPIPETIVENQNHWNRALRQNIQHSTIVVRC